MFSKRYELLARCSKRKNSQSTSKGILDLARKRPGGSGRNNNKSNKTTREGRAHKVNIKKDVPIYVLAASILLSTIIYVKAPHQESSGKLNNTNLNSDYVSSVQYKKDKEALVQLITIVAKSSASNTSCLNSLRVISPVTNTVGC